jgi:hypothetical protein
MYSTLRWIRRDLAKRQTLLRQEQVPLCSVLQSIYIAAVQPVAKASYTSLHWQLTILHLVTSAAMPSCLWSKLGSCFPAWVDWWLRAAFQDAKPTLRETTRVELGMRRKHMSGMQ